MRRYPRFSLFCRLLLGGVWPVLAGCAKPTNEVVVYTSVDQVFAEPVLRDFEKQTGITVRPVFDTEETKSTGVVNRLIAEAANPQADVFWSGDPLRADLLKQRGITTAYASPAAADIKPLFKDPAGHWTGFSARARVLLVNTDKLRPADWPTSILDLAKPRYRNQVAIANPLFGTTSFHVAALFAQLGEGKTQQFLSDLKRNGVAVAASNGDVKKCVVQGEVAMGLTDSDDANEARKEGAPVQVVFLDQQGFGNLIVPNTVSLLKGSPHPDNGKKLIDYLLSRETEAKLARSCAQMPLHAGVAVPATVPSLDKIVPLAVDYGATARLLETHKTYLKQWAESR
ncbi:iron ABC transporter substrate-binding protein [Hymenobacter lapidarius]|uniref:Iron ABC transporter substrate-binding protein n=1 Tax=Hymenobacter lapidarius TaxID=1908237 RepID=A0A1G1T964_9BACT|nr:extracellular solute-binding protein [Hymenobacter lapidarius]OGX87403.1 iron ABC transporter substrate-binding protein [Hymenobacter lapidarius]